MSTGTSHTVISEALRSSKDAGVPQQLILGVLERGRIGALVGAHLVEFVLLLAQPVGEFDLVRPYRSMPAITCPRSPFMRSRSATNSACSFTVRSLPAAAAANSATRFSASSSGVRRAAMKSTTSCTRLSRASSFAASGMSPLVQI